MPLPSREQIETGNYPKWTGNDSFTKVMLKHVGLPEDYHPTEEEAYRITLTALEDEE